MDKEILKGIEVELEVLQNRLTDLEPGSDEYGDVHDLYLEELDRYIKAKSLELENIKEENRFKEKQTDQIHEHEKIMNDYASKERELKNDDYKNRENKKLEYIKTICEVGKDTFIVYALGKVIKQSWENELGKGEILTNSVGKECTRDIFSFALRKFGH